MAEVRPAGVRRRWAGPGLLGASVHVTATAPRIGRTQYHVGAAAVSAVCVEVLGPAEAAAGGSRLLEASALRSPFLY